MQYIVRHLTIGMFVGDIDLLLAMSINLFLCLQRVCYMDVF